ncbi:MAG: ATP synthase F0 subunit B [Terriglobales bacterium]
MSIKLPGNMTEKMKRTTQSSSPIVKKTIVESPTVKKTTVKKTILKKSFVGPCIVLVIAACLWLTLPASFASAQAQPASPQTNQNSANQDAKNQDSKNQSPDDAASKNSAAQPAGEAAPAEHQPTSIGGELAKETRESEDEGGEEHADLKHSTMVQKLARVTGLSVHGAHILALVVNFAIIVVLLVWALRKTVPGIMGARNESIQKALEEARKASAEAGKRLSDIENRLQQMDVEIGRMQSSAEKEAAAEDERIKKAAEDDLRKVVQAAEQEIAAAAKQIRRELSIHTADLAVMLARKQINVDSNTDQVLVRNFSAHLAEPGKSGSPGDGGRNGGKDGR